MPTTTTRKPQEIADELSALIDRADSATVAPNLQDALRLQAEFCQAVAVFTVATDHALSVALVEAQDALHDATQPAA